VNLVAILYLILVLVLIHIFILVPVTILIHILVLVAVLIARLELIAVLQFIHIFQLVLFLELILLLELFPSPLPFTGLDGGAVAVTGAVGAGLNSAVAASGSCAAATSGTVAITATAATATATAATATATLGEKDRLGSVVPDSAELPAGQSSRVSMSFRFSWLDPFREPRGSPRPGKKPSLPSRLLRQLGHLSVERSAAFRPRLAAGLALTKISFN